MITPDEGLKSAKILASKNKALFVRAERVFGKTITPFVGNWPKSVAVAHVVNVNPQLLTVPPITSDRRRGFMYASYAAVNKSGVAWQKLDEPVTGAYVWGYDVNSTSLSLYTSNQTVFTEPNEDFWKCAYAAHIVGPSTFNYIWNRRTSSYTLTFANLLDGVNNLNKNLPNWPIVKLKTALFIGCNYVFELARGRGSMVSTGYGIQPVLTAGSMQQIFIEQ